MGMCNAGANDTADATYARWPASNRGRRSPRAGRRASTSLAAVAVTLALGTMACGSGGAAAVVDESSALDAIVDTLDASYSWSASVEVALTEAQIDELVEMDERGGASTPTDEGARTPTDESARQAREEFDHAMSIVDGFRLHGAVADDDSMQLAWEQDGRDLIDIRLDVADLMSSETLEPDTTILVKPDVTGLVELFSQGQADDLLAGIDQWRTMAQDALPEQLGDVVLALLDGQFAGVSGTIDLTQFGMSEDDLDQARAEMADQFGLDDPGAQQQILETAITIRDIETSGGVTTAIVDLHPRDAAAAMQEQVETSDLLDEGLGGILPDSAAEELPELVSGFASLAFDEAGNLTEVRVDLLSLAVEFGEPDAEMLAMLDEGQFEAVLTFSDHDAVDTVMDVEATTVPWDLVQLFMGGMGEGFGEPGEGMGEPGEDLDGN